MPHLPSDNLLVEFLRWKTFFAETSDGKERRRPGTFEEHRACVTWTSCRN